MERVLGLALGIAICFLVMFAISRFSKGKIKADLFGAVNCFLYFGLLINLLIPLLLPQGIFALGTAGFILLILIIRRRGSGRWI